MMTGILYTNTEILPLSEVGNLIKKGKKQHKNSLKIKVRQIECGCGDRYSEVIVFQRTELEAVENCLKAMNHSFKYETKSEPLPAEQNRYGGNTLLTTFLVIKL